MALTKATDGRVAGHHTNRFALMGNERGFRTMSCSRCCCLTARVTATNNNDIE
ncbi:hypothetical protein Agau_C100995 [Agrobacterium tumefaciens F2]|nr:hypothetical protein Agau_C100995 [Agrobacterium tumefaciens F2]